MSTSWSDHFTPFSALHLIAAAVSVAIMAALVLAGRTLRGTPAERRLRRAWGWSILLFQLVAGIWWLLPQHFEAQRSIPLNMCRLVAIVAAAAMLVPISPRSRGLHTLLYFWGLGLCTQALITPVFPEGPAHPLFWIFWIGHTQIVGSALYDLVVLRYRPTTRDFLFLCLANAAYLAVVIPLNAAFSLNYGGLGPTTFDAPNLAKKLGPWPWRPIWIVLIAQAWLTVLWVVWRPFRPSLFSQSRMCAGCGYDLTGFSRAPDRGVVCLECGTTGLPTAIAEDPKQKPPAIAHPLAAPK